MCWREEGRRERENECEQEVLGIWDLCLCAFAAPLRMGDLQERARFSSATREGRRESGKENTGSMCLRFVWGFSRYKDTEMGVFGHVWKCG
jgi:hypothetical protein